MKVGFRPKRKSLFTVVYMYIPNGIITGGFYEPVPFLLFRPVKKVVPVTKCCIYNQFSVAFILHSIKAVFLHMFIF